MKLVELHFPGSEVIFSGSWDELPQRAKQLSVTFDAVIACGGDGTIQRTASALAGSECRFGVVPMGSGNDFSKTLGMSRNLDKAIEQLKNAEPAKTDLIRFGADGKPGVMINTLGIGFDGLANHETTQIKWLKGPLVYLMAALKASFKSRAVRFRIQMDGQEMEADLLMITLANGTTEGGSFRIAPMADPHDGLLNVVTIQPMTVLGLLLRLPLFLFRLQERSKKIRFHTCKKIEIRGMSPFAVHADGEQIGLEISTIEAEVMEGAITILKPSG